jgi:hypothetical protein
MRLVSMLQGPQAEMFIEVLRRVEAVGLAKRSFYDIANLPVAHMHALPPFLRGVVVGVSCSPSAGAA